MAMPFLTVPEFPSIPDLPGVPSIPRNPLAALPTIFANQISGFLGLFSPVFGVFDANGNRVLSPDTFLGIEYTNSRRIANFPVEQGSFASYNKVNDPFSGMVRMAVGGTVQDRSQFLADLQTLADSLDLFTLVTPEESYPNVNMERYDYRRDTRDGAGVIVAMCRFVEIRMATTVYSGQTSVPASQVTGPTTSTGLISSQATASATALPVQSYGTVTATPLPPISTAAM